jgi:predicted nucleic acid-binding protein
MSGKVFFDTSVLIYAIAGDDGRSAQAESLLAAGGNLSVQVLNEFAAVARRKLNMSWKEISEALGAVRVLCEPPGPLTIAIHDAAVRIAEFYGYHIYDSLILAAALDAKCNLLYSDDMQDGQTIDSLTIRNPFAGGHETG